MDDRAYVILVLIAAALVPIALILSHVEGKRRDLKALKDFASSRGFLEFRGEHHSPMVRGVFEGVEIRVSFTERQLVGAQGPRSMFVTALGPRLNGHVRIYRNGLLNKLLFARDTSVGDAAFDAAHIIESDPADLAARAITPALRRELEQFPAGFELDLGRNGLILSLAAGDLRETAVLDCALRLVVTAALGRALRD